MLQNIRANDEREPSVLSGQSLFQVVLHQAHVVRKVTAVSIGPFDTGDFETALRQKTSEVAPAAPHV